MTDHRFILEPYKGIRTRYQCPGCGKKELSRYIDQESGTYVGDNVGRCNREVNCGYHYTPKMFFADNGGSQSNANKADGRRWTQAPEVKPSFIDSSVFRQSLTGYGQNFFISYLITIFGSEVTGELISRYFIGTSKHWPGATAFWQIDVSGKIRAGKIMLYQDNGHRVKNPFNHITWVHKVLNIADYSLRQCLFGEHLIKDSTLPIAVVESEKTALIASIYLPGFIWLSCGQKNGLSIEKCQPLAGRSVVLFPDLGGFEAWSRKAEELEKAMPGIRIAVSDLLERKASSEDRQKGLDLADYLVKFDYREFLARQAAGGQNPVSGILTELIAVGNTDAMQLNSGRISANEWSLRSDELCARIKSAEVAFDDYVKHVKKIS